MLLSHIQPWQGIYIYICVCLQEAQMDGCLLSSIRDLSYPSLLFVLPVRNEITPWLRQGTQKGNWYRTVNTTPVLYTEDEPVTSEQHKKATPAEEHMLLFSLQQSSHFRRRYYLFLKIPFPVSASLTRSSESPESGSYPFLLLFALKTSLEVLCACVFVLFLLLVVGVFFFSSFFFPGLDVHKCNKEIRSRRTVACKSVNVLFN